MRDGGAMFLSMDVKQRQHDYMSECFTLEALMTLIGYTIYG